MAGVALTADAGNHELSALTVSQVEGISAPIYVRPDGADGTAFNRPFETTHSFDFTRVRESSCLFMPTHTAA